VDKCEPRRKDAVRLGALRSHVVAAPPAGCGARGAGRQQQRQGRSLPGRGAPPAAAVPRQTRCAGARDAGQGGGAVAGASVALGWCPGCFLLRYIWPPPTKG
jgi:hypothetical protein